MLFNFLVVATFLSLGSAIPLASPQTGPDGGAYRWSVKNWLSDCVKGGISDCNYQFTIEGRYADPGIPPFRATCEGPYNGESITDGPFKSCTVREANKSVTARILGMDDDPLNILLQVSYQYTVGSETSVFTNRGAKGRLLTGKNPQNFDIDNITKGAPQ